MSRDLESLLAARPARRVLRPNSNGRNSGARASIQIGRATVYIEPGQIQEYTRHGNRTVVGLPANEYFDDECVNDTNSSLGAFVQHHFGDRCDEFLAEIQAETVGLPSQRVPRAERRVDDSFGIGQALYLRGLVPDYHIIVVSATTERVGIGLRAEPHFLYAAIQGIIETMNAHRLNSLAIPVLGSGHGGMPRVVALLFNLLALRSILSEDTGRHIREIRIVVTEQAAAEISDEDLEDVIAQVTG